METILVEKAVRSDFLMSLWPEEAKLIHLMHSIWPFEAWISNIPVHSSLVISQIKIWSHQSLLLSLGLETLLHLYAI